ncbi:MAG: carbohydrate binding domain-containing protein [Polyangiaceae bacterium]
MNFAYWSGRAAMYWSGACAVSLVLFSACIRERNAGCATNDDCGSNATCSSGTCMMANGGTTSADGGATGSGGTSSASGGASGGAESASGGASGGSSASGGSTSSEGGATTAQGGSASTSGGSSSASGGATSTGNTDMVDDLEDGDSRILQVNGRQGPWHTFNSGDSGGSQVPAGPTISPAGEGANGSKGSMHISGNGYMFAGIGFDLNNADTVPESAQSKAYDASAWTGVVFMAKGGSSSTKIRLELPMRDFVPPDRGGSCSGTCWNVYGYEMSSALGTSWQEVKVPFSMLVREEGGTSPAFDAKQLMSISFKTRSAPFDFWIDDVRFYKD